MTSRITLSYNYRGSETNDWGLAESLDKDAIEKIVKESGAMAKGFQTMICFAEEHVIASNITKDGSKESDTKSVKIGIFRMKEIKQTRYEEVLSLVIKGVQELCIASARHFSRI